MTSSTIKSSKKEKVPYHKKPKGMSMNLWQIALRKQFAGNNSFGIKNIGLHAVFSDYKVYNPVTQNYYKVSIRDKNSNMNFCTCMDFKTNMLGTCKHIEAVLLKLNKKDLSRKLLQRNYTPHYTSIYLKYGEKREVKIRIGSSNFEDFKIWAKKYFDKNYSLLPDSFDKIENVLRQGTAIHDDFRCYDDALEFIIKERNNKTRKMLAETISNNPDLYFSSLIRTTLFPYQQQGVLYALKAGRALIADEMGLGKTIQAIAFAETLRKEKLAVKTLVVCPTSLKYQWKSEIERFTDSKVTVVEGPFFKRREFYKATDVFYNIISYNLVKHDLDVINLMDNDLIILDEAQRIKNWKTQTAQNVKKLKSPYTVVLTGTPLENKLEELYSIVQFVDPFKLGPLYQFLESHQIKDEFEKVVGYKDLNRIGEVLSEILLRRNKQQVQLQLPERMDKILFVPLTPQQQKIHAEYRLTVSRLVAKWKKFGFLSEEDRQRLIIALNIMRMVCDSTYIIDQETRYDTKIEELMFILEEIFNNSEEKVVIFSQWERMTRLIAKELDILEIKFEYLHGGVPSEARKKLFDNFNTDSKCRVFLSTDAGGLGLNLQSASVVINMDIPWNPAVLEQRIARAHRLGQKRKVSVINFVSSYSIEHGMLTVHKFKTSMAKGVLDGGEDTIFMGESSFSAFMKTVDAITSDIPTTTDSSSEETIDEKEETSTPLLSDKEELFSVEESQSEDDDLLPATVSPSTKTLSESSNPSGNGSHQKQDDISKLITAGIDFLGKLTATFSDPKSADSLVKSLVEQDKQTGKNYIKIPVENEQVVQNALNILTNIFKSMGK